MSSLLARHTRFRAYQLGVIGSSFSYFNGASFTLIEARITDRSRPSLQQELESCIISRISCLHITSWDADHCGESDLEEILKRYRPHRIEYPGYPPPTEAAKRCLRIIKAHRKTQASVSIQRIDPAYLSSLRSGEYWGYRDIFYHPCELSDNHNDNSTIKLFRSGCFNVASLGDVESSDISLRLRDKRIFNSEVDVMILAHHGADNGFMNKRFLQYVRPTIAVCSSNYDNQFDHPRDRVREILHELQIPILTTKTGDVVIESIAPHKDKYKAVNLKADSTEISSVKEHKAKKSKILRQNADTVKELYSGRQRSYKRIRR